MPHLMTDRTINIFLSMIYEKYIERNGYSLHKLSEHSFPFTYTPDNELFIERNGNVQNYLCTEYFKELQSREFMERNGSNFYLSAKGFTEGYRLKHPVKYFWQVHWKWGIATGIAILAFISTAIYRYGAACGNG